MQAVLQTKPSTPAECCRAAKVLADLHRPDLAKTFLQKVLDGKPDAAQLVDLAKEFGAAMFLDLASQPELCPPARQLADAVTAANNRQLQDPKRLADLLKKIHDPSDDVRTEAIAGLKDGRGGIGRIGGRPDRGRMEPTAPARSALVAMGYESVAPMLAILDGDNAEMKLDAVKVLASLGGREAALALLAPSIAAGADPQVRAAAARARAIAGTCPHPAGSDETAAERGESLLSAATADSRRTRRPRAGVVLGSGQA